ncbi:MAG: cobalamin biosynthesis protein CbiX [Pseudomonadota bacterium]
MRVFLVDNGSLRPQAVLALRAVATKLAEQTGLVVEAVSLLHSSKIPPQKLEGAPASIVEERLAECTGAGELNILILPMFLGPSLAIEELLFRLIRDAQLTTPQLKVRVAPPLAGNDAECPDIRLARILADHVQKTVERDRLSKPVVALVDHGTPHRPVNRLRNAVARQLDGLLEAEVSEVIACSMERRDGDEFSFNEPLLESIGGGSLSNKQCVAAMFFLLPGRHAGPGGDVAEICDGLIERRRFRSLHISPLLAFHPLTCEILSDRIAEAVESEPARM